MIKIGATHAILEDPDGKFDQIVERWHSLELMRSVSDPPAAKVYRGKNLLFPNYPSLPTPRINQIVIPTGATRWSYGLFLATDSMKTAILAEAAERTDNKVQFEFSSADNFRDPNVKPFKIWMHPLQPRPLSPRAPAGTATVANSAVEGLWLMPFVDRRYWWQFKSVGKMSAESFSKISDVVTFLGLKLDTTIQLTCLNSKYDKIPDIKNNDNENAAIVLETLAWHIGCQLVPETNITTPTGQEETFGRNYSLVSVEESPLIYAKNLEGKIGIRPCVRTNVGTANEAVTIPNDGWENVGKPSILMGGEYQDTGKQLPASVLIKGRDVYNEKTAASVGVTAATMSGASAILRLTFTGAPTIPDALATRIAKDYYGRFAKLYDWTFAGVQPWQPTAFDDCVVVFQSKYPAAVIQSDSCNVAEFGGFRVQTRVRGWVANLRPESPETGATAEDTPEPVESEFTCGNCLACLDASDTEKLTSACADADPSPLSWFIYDDASACCDNVADSNIELIHDSGCLWSSEERECKERFIEESWLDPADAEVDEAIFHKWTLEIDGDWVVLKHIWYRKT